MAWVSGSLPPWPLGGGYPAVIVWAVTVCGAWAPPLHVPRGGLEPPPPDLGRLWGVRACPAPLCETFLIPSALLLSVWLGWPEATPAQLWEGSEGGWDVPWQGRVSCGNKTLENLVRLLVVDHWACASMKNAARCEN